MRHPQRLLVGLAWSALLALLPSAPSWGQGYKAQVSIGDVRYLSEQARGQSHTRVLTAQYEYKQALGASGELALKSFGRVDTRSHRGSYVDLPIAKYSYSGKHCRADIGFDTVFWGVVESQRVVNVVNQVDLLRSLKGDVTMGQPMVSLTFFNASTKLETYVLPWFRERRFGGDTFHLGTPLPIDDRLPLYENRRHRHHVDYAARLAHQHGALDAGLSFFTGTLRDPRFIADLARQVLRPYYTQGQQIGLDAQLTRGSTLFKLEAKRVLPEREAGHEVFVYGIEQVWGDFGFLPFEVSGFLEHNRDSRGLRSPTLYQNDLFVGTRIDFANTLSTVLNIGLFHDLDHHSKLWRVQLESRLNDDFSIALEGYAFHARSPADTMHAARDLDQLSVKLIWTF